MLLEVQYKNVICKVQTYKTAVLLLIPEIRAASNYVHQRSQDQVVLLVGEQMCCYATLSNCKKKPIHGQK